MGVVHLLWKHLIANAKAASTPNEADTVSTGHMLALQGGEKTENQSFSLILKSKRVLNSSLKI